MNVIYVKNRAVRMDEYVTGTGQRMYVHVKEDCRGPPCIIHAPSDHNMRHFKTHWRQDRGLMERICPHGIGHPDPDDLWFKDLVRGKGHSEGVHGCDGCCIEKT